MPRTLRAAGGGSRRGLGTKQRLRYHARQMMLFCALEPHSDASCGGYHGNDAYDPLHWLTLLLADLRMQISALRKSGKVSGVTGWPENGPPR